MGFSQGVVSGRQEDARFAAFHLNRRSFSLISVFLVFSFILQADQAVTLALNGSSSLYADGIALAATHTATWIPLAFVLFYAIVRNNDISGIGLTLLGVALCVLLADQMSSSVCKPLFGRYRPAQDPHIMYIVDTVNGYRGGLYGFFSSHAANTMAIATFLALVARYRPLTYILLSWAALNGWSRIYLGVHYFGDVMVGFLWGGVVGWGIYLLWRKLMRRIFTQSQTLQTEDGLNATFAWTAHSARLLAASVVVTYIYVAFAGLWKL